MLVDEVENSSHWSREQDKAFENAIATYDEDDPDRWEKIAGDVEGKTIEEIQVHYEILVYDVNEIEAGRVPAPSYSYVYEDSASLAGEEGSSKKGNLNSESGNGGKGSRADQERRKGIAWTEDEHRLFLLGLDKYGKGDWRSISRNFVVTRTPTQVASHAQKYFIRLNSMNKDRRRSSIHDITNAGNADISVPGPITGQSNGIVPGNSSGKTNKQSSQPRVVSPGPSMGMYGQPPAVGTPVSLPTHMAYGVRTPGSGSMVSGAPVNMGSMTYPLPHTTAHR